MSERCLSTPVFGSIVTSMAEMSTPLFPSPGISDRKMCTVRRGAPEGSSVCLIESLSV